MRAASQRPAAYQRDHHLPGVVIPLAPLFSSCKGTSAQNPRLQALDERTRRTLRGYTERITLARTTTKYFRKLAQYHACRESRSSSRMQPGEVDGENHVLERARSPMCAPRKTERQEVTRGFRSFDASVLETTKGSGNKFGIDPDFR